MSNTYYSDERPMSVGDWFVTRLVLSIPIVNIVMYLIWSLGSAGNVNRRNYCIASILLWFIVAGLFGVLFAVMAIFGAFAQHDTYVNSFGNLYK